MEDVGSACTVAQSQLELSLESLVAGIDDASNYATAIDEYGANLETLSVAVSTLTLCARGASAFADPDQFTDACMCPSQALAALSKSDCSYFESSRLVMYYVKAMELLGNQDDGGGAFLDGEAEEEGNSKECVKDGSRADCIVLEAAERFGDAAETVSVVCQQQCLSDIAALYLSDDAAAVAGGDEPEAGEMMLATVVAEEEKHESVVRVQMGGNDDGALTMVGQQVGHSQRHLMTVVVSAGLVGAGVAVLVCGMYAIGFLFGSRRAVRRQQQQRRHKPSPGREAVPLYTTGF